jgi:hypothetical protein
MSALIKRIVFPDFPAPVPQKTRKKYLGGAWVEHTLSNFTITEKELDFRSEKNLVGIIIKMQFLPLGVETPITICNEINHAWSVTDKVELGVAVLGNVYIGSGDVTDSANVREVFFEYVAEKIYVKAIDYFSGAGVNTVFYIKKVYETNTEV